MDKDGCISLQGNTYEVDLELIGKKVLIRYDPFHLKEIQVMYEGKKYRDAVPVHLSRLHDKRVKPEKPREEPVQKEETELSFFSAAEKKRLEQIGAEGMNYAQMRGNGK